MNDLYPDFFARFYDVIYHQMRDDADKDFFLSEVNQCTGKVLEIGVGTGRFFSNALGSGADIFGIDISESMLNVLRTKIPASQHFRVSCQNMTNFSFDCRFDLITAPFRVFMHLVEKEDQIDALNNVYNHLNPGGKFVFDAFIPDLNQLINGLDNHIDFEGEYENGKFLRRTVSTRPELVSQLIHIAFKLEWEAENGLQSNVWKTPLRYFFRYELEHLIERSLFRNYKLYGGFDRRPLDESSREFVVECLK